MIKILLVERNVILRNHLLEVFNQDEQLNVVGWCTEGNEVITFLKSNQVDVILMDHLQINGLVITVQVKKEFPNTKVIGFSTGDVDNSNDRLIELGATSYLSKYDTNLEELVAKMKNFTSSN